MRCSYCDRTTYIEPPFYGCSDGCRTTPIKPATIREERCQNCEDDKDVEVDHAIPKARGGCECEYNLWTLCRRCNRTKGTMTIEEFYNSGVAAWCAEQTAREWHAWIEEDRREQDERLWRLRSKA
jgi:hypothetical protein